MIAWSSLRHLSPPWGQYFSLQGRLSYIHKLSYMWQVGTLLGLMVSGTHGEFFLTGVYILKTGQKQ